MTYLPPDLITGDESVYSGRVKSADGQYQAITGSWTIRLICRLGDGAVFERTATAHSDQATYPGLFWYRFADADLPNGGQLVVRSVVYDPSGNRFSELEPEVLRVGDLPITPTAP